MAAARRLVAVGAAMAAATCLVTGSAQGAPPADPVTGVASGLNGPFQLAADRGGLIVTESLPGQVTRIDRRTGETTPVVTGVPGAAGAVRIGRTYVIVTGEASPEEPTPVEGSSVQVAHEGGEPRLLADLMAYELANNPDGQIQFVEGQPVDALSNPFNVVRDRTGQGFVIVADAGANVVLRVTRSGEVSTLFVPPVVREGECATRENNTPDGYGCDPVPTGLAWGPGNKLYVSTLGAEAPGAGKVYVLNARTGAVLDVIEDLDSPTGVAVDPRGNVYVSNVIEGAPPGEEPPPGFDPSSVGDITMIARDGHRSVAQVTMPTGLLWRNGTLYSSAWSIAFFLGIADAGEVVEVGPAAFTS
jgi:hypothetical protein